MCLIDLIDYPEASRLQRVREHHDFLTAPAPNRAHPSPSCVQDAVADPLACGAGSSTGFTPLTGHLPASQATFYIVRTRHGIPRVPTNRERLAVWHIRRGMACAHADLNGDLR